jgi:uroporphyrinogen-III synthase
MRPVHQRPVLVLRPEPGNTATCRAAHAHGLHVHAAPLFVYTPLDWALPDAAPWDGLLIGSAAVFAHGGPLLDTLRAVPVPVPVHAVGPTTARAALKAGFGVADTGSGGLQTMVGALAQGRYLRLAGAAHVPLAPPAGVEIVDVVVYAAKPQPLAQSAIDCIRREPVLALLHSGEAARWFAEQCTAHDLPRGQIALACLAPRIGAAAGENWERVGIAQRPDDEALLSLARQMCQTV